jgi:hypothetical protein
VPPSTPYSIARAELIADQIGRFASQHVHQLAGHHANLEFWLAEAASAVRALDEYQQRFKRLQEAQLAWVREHDTKLPRYCAVCRGACELGPETPDRPHRVPSEERDAARDAVRRAVRQFLLRLFKAGFVSVEEVRRGADTVGASIEQEDLEGDA